MPLNEKVDLKNKILQMSNIQEQHLYHLDLQKSLIASNSPSPLKFNLSESDVQLNSYNKKDCSSTIQKARNNFYLGKSVQKKANQSNARF